LPVFITSSSLGPAFTVTGGNVGIGTTTPGYNSAFTDNILTVNGGTGRGMMELATSAADGTGQVVGQFGFFATSNTGANGMQTAAIFSMTTGTTANDRGGDLRFYTKADGGAISEHLHIDSVGNVGIGTSAPGYNSAYTSNILTVNGGTGRGMMELATSAADANNVSVGQFGFFTTGNTGTNGKQVAAIMGNAIGTTTHDRGGDIRMYTKADGGTVLERLRIDNTGNIGVGTSAPAYRLDVSGDIRATAIHTTGGFQIAENGDMYLPWAHNYLSKTIEDLHRENQELKQMLVRQAEEIEILKRHR
jgi:hypothetical protein